MSKVDCGKRCIKMDFIDLWCGHAENGYCSAVDKKNGMLNFNDDHHIILWDH
jgi:hypothetical protein